MAGDTYVCLIEVVAAVTDENPPGPVHIVDQRRLATKARAKAKAKNKGKSKNDGDPAESSNVFKLKIHNGNGQGMPTVFDSGRNKQILQLSVKMCPGAHDRVRTWVGELNNGTKIVQAVLDECNAIKRGN